MDAEDQERELAKVNEALASRRDAERETWLAEQGLHIEELKNRTAAAVAARVQLLEKAPVQSEASRRAELAELAERADLARKREKSERRDRQWRYFLSSRGVEYENCTLDTFECTRPTRRDAVAICQRYIDQLPEHFDRGEGLVFYGPCCAGKDHLAVAVCRAAILKWGSQATWISGTKLYNGLKDTFNKRSAVTTAEFRESLEEAQLLCISDPVVAIDRSIDRQTGESSLVYGLSPCDANQLNELIDERRNHHRPTLITINAKDEAAAATMLPKQVIDRLRQASIAISCYWPSYRDQHRPELVAAE